MNVLCAHARVIAGVGGLVALAEANEIGRNHAVAAPNKDRNHFPVEIRPRRLAVHEQHHVGCIARPLVDIVHAQTAAVAVVYK